MWRSEHLFAEKVHYVYQTLPSLAVRFVTHEEHLEWLHLEIFSGTLGIELVAVATPAIVSSSHHFGVGASSAGLWTSAQQSTCFDACEGVGLVAFNLFALEVKTARGRP